MFIFSQTQPTTGTFSEDATKDENFHSERRPSSARENTDISSRMTKVFTKKS